jgi:hypothetical protein
MPIHARDMPKLEFASRGPPANLCLQDRIGSVTEYNK